jgi:hypothetical protein
MRSHWIAAGIILSFAAMLVALPLIHWLRWDAWVICPFHALTGLPCPTCGYSRAFDLVLQGRLAAALRFQPFVLLIVLLSGIAAGWAMVSLAQKKELKLPKVLVQGIWVALAMSWAWNLCHRI